MSVESRIGGTPTDAVQLPIIVSEGLFNGFELFLRLREVIWDISNRTVALDPFDEPVPIDVDTGPDTNETGLETIALAVVNPPADSLFPKGWKVRYQLVNCQDVLSIHEQTLSFDIMVLILWRSAEIRQSLA